VTAESFITVVVDVGEQLANSSYQLSKFKGLLLVPLENHGYPKRMAIVDVFQHDPDKSSASIALMSQSGATLEVTHHPVQVVEINALTVRSVVLLTCC